MCSVSARLKLCQQIIRQPRAPSDISKLPSSCQQPRRWKLRLGDELKRLGVGLDRGRRKSVLGGQEGPRSIALSEEIPNRYTRRAFSVATNWAPPVVP